MASVANGKLYTVGSGQPGTSLSLLHLYGTPYQMGFAQAQLMRDQLLVRGEDK